jgi:chromosomal replication initiator protein
MTAYIAPGLMDPEEVIAQHWNIKLADMYKRTRQRDIVEARQVAMWYMVTIQRYTLHQAGDVFKLDHATVHYARNAVNDLMQVDRAFRLKVTAVVNKLRKITPKVNNESNIL